MDGKQISYPIEDRWSYLWLVLGIILSLFTVPIGNYGIPLAFWIGSLFFIRFMRTQRRWWLAALLIAISTFLTAYLVLPDWLGMIRPTSAAGAAILTSLVYIADRLMVQRLPGFLATLVFPLGYTALEFINTFGSPLGSWGTSVYAQAGNLPLLQLVAITGMWGVSFLVAWPSTLINWAWERNFAWKEVGRGLAAYIGILVLVLLFGQLRLMLAPSPEDTVRVAGIVAVDFRAEQDEWNRLVEEDWEGYRQMAKERHAVYFEETAREAEAGAQIVLWPEAAAISASEDEAELIAQAQEAARQHGIYLAMPMFVQSQDDPTENKMLVFDPEGEIVLEHMKYGGKGMEGNRVDGDGILRTFATPFGVLSGVICWDTDFPGTVLQAGRNGTDILLSPSLDLKDASPLHAYMAKMRAIENGVSVVRVADNGLSAVYDPYGRTLATMDHFTAGERVIVAQVPAQGTGTIYPIIGDLFGWLAVAGFVALIVYGIVLGRRARTAEVEAQAPGEEDLAPAS